MGVANLIFVGGVLAACFQWDDCRGADSPYYEPPNLVKQLPTIRASQEPSNGFVYFANVWQVAPIKDGKLVHKLGPTLASPAYCELRPRIKPLPKYGKTAIVLGTQFSEHYLPECFALPTARGMASFFEKMQEPHAQQMEALNATIKELQERVKLLEEKK